MQIDKFIKNNIVIFLAANTGALFNLLYQLVMARLLSPALFAGLNSLLSLLTIITVPLAAFSIMLTKHISSSNARNESEELKSIWRKLSAHALIFSCVVFFIVVVFSRGISGFLHLDSQTAIIILGGIFFLTGISAPFTGVLQGLEKFNWLAFVMVLSGFLKLAFSVGMVKFFSPLNGALLGFLVAVFLGVTLSALPVRFLFLSKPAKNVDLKKLYFYIFPVLCVSLCMALLTNIDMVMVKHFFVKEASAYSFAQMVGKIVFFLPGMASVVLFSRASGLHATNSDSRNVLKQSLVFTCAVCLLAAAIYNLFPHVCLRILTGSSSSESIALGRFFSFAMFFLAVNNILFSYQLSTEKYYFIRPLIIATVLQIAAIALLHKNIFWVISIVLVNSLVIFAMNLKSAFARTTK